FLPARQSVAGEVKVSQSVKTCLRCVNGRRTRLDGAEKEMVVAIAWRSREGAPMTDSGSSAGRHPVVLGPGEGRAYPMGCVSAVFKADGEETRQGYSISEWWLDAHTKGPGPHSHPEDDVFYVLAGTMNVMVGTEWIEASTGSFV